jgi:tRNA pseudouridine55 synthase
VDKPEGPTSHDVIRRVRRVFGLRAVGHTGTLDPFASGLLVVLLGPATRVARFVEASAKTYLAVARLGIGTDTDDRTGRPLGAPVDVSAVSEAQVRAALAVLTGTQQQRPPAYSAKHVGGERSHRLARKGRGVELPPSAVTVHRNELVAWREGEVTFRTVVSAGTYVRALARDLGQALGVGAHLVALRREAIGSLRVQAAVPLDRLSPDTPLLPVRRVLAELPALELDPTARAAVRHGRAVRADRALGAGDAVLLTAGGDVVAVARIDNEWLRPSVVLEGA